MVPLVLSTQGPYQKYHQHFRVPSLPGLPARSQSRLRDAMRWSGKTWGESEKPDASQMNVSVFNGKSMEI